MRAIYTHGGFRWAVHQPLIAMLALLVPITVPAAPLVAAGDIALRHDIQLLADYGVIKSPVTSWPMAWGAIITDLDGFDGASELPAAASRAFMRVEERARQATRIGYLGFEGSASLASNPRKIRSFADTPREDAEVSGGLSWTGDLLSVNLTATAVDSPADGQDVRADGSMVGIALGNWSIAASTMDRWWGPGWDGSLILSNNARPIPSVVIDRTLNTPFSSKWLSWIGPWDLSLMWGQLESDRVVPNAQIFGMRFNFKPHPSFEIGLSRTAQWCGDGRPCDLGTFKELLIGNDNRGDAGVTASNEPGNQLAGVDARWAPRWFDLPLAFYAQIIGEDEAGGLPSRNMAMGGMELTGMTNNWSWRWFAELASTKCDFLEPDGYNCAYNHSIYQTGYRYRGRAIGHGADNDAKLVSTGLVLVSDNGTTVNALLRVGPLNRVGDDARNTVAATPTDLRSFDIAVSREFRYGQVDLGLGYESLEVKSSGEKSSENRAFLRWRSGF